MLAFSKIAESFVIAYIQAVSSDDVFNVKCTENAYFAKMHKSNKLKLSHNISSTPCIYWTSFGAIRMRILHYIETCMIQYTTEISRAPPMRRHGFKTARRVCDTYEMCNCLNLFC